MASETFDIDTLAGYRAWERWMHRLEAQAKGAATAAMYNAAVMARDEVVRQIHIARPYPPINTSQMVTSWAVVPVQDGFAVQNPTPQAVWMEDGTRPHWVPLGALMAWAQQKTRGGGNAFLLARAAQRAIARRGIRPRHYFRKAQAKFVGFIDRAIRMEWDRIK